MMRTSSERKYLLHSALGQSCFLLLVTLGEEREHIGKEKPNPRMRRGDDGVNLGKGDGSTLAEAAERWGPVEGRVQKTCMRGHRAEMPLSPPACGH